MRIFSILVILLIMPTVAAAEDKDNYAAVGYSTRTGEYWLSYGLATKELAESEITKRAKDKDSLTIVVVKNCYVALAMSKDGKAFGAGEADTPNEAEQKALAECRKRTKQKCAIVVTLHAAQGVGGDSYSCIAYSAATGRFAVSVAKASRSEAEVESVAKCKADDAKVVATATKNCAALALGKDKGAYGVGVADTEKEAQEKALAECKKKTTDCFIAVTLTGNK